MTNISKESGQWRSAALLLLLGFLATGCGLLPRPMPRPFDAPPSVLLTKVPFFAQQANQCGPAALAMALSWSGLQVQPTELQETIFTPDRHGSLQNDLIGASRRHGRLAYPIREAEALFSELGAGHPVIVLVNLGLSWYPKWHYAVVVGYDRPSETIIIHSGATPYERLPFRVFANTWQRSNHWGLLVLPPDELPATAEASAYLDAVLGLEKTKQWQAAATAYQKGAERWPANDLLQLGLGNSRYALHDLTAAEHAFRAACHLNPHNGAAWNNLAQTLKEEGKHQEALAAAIQAIQQGGPLVRQFRQTAAEIRAEMSR